MHFVRLRGRRRRRRSYPERILIALVGRRGLRWRCADPLDTRPRNCSGSARRVAYLNELASSCHRTRGRIRVRHSDGTRTNAYVDGVARRGPIDSRDGGRRRLAGRPVLRLARID